MSGENAPEATETTTTTEGTETEVVEQKKTLEQLTPEELIDYVKTLRKENASHRTAKQLKDKELEEFRAWKDSQKTELERAQEENATLKQDNLSLLKTSIALGAGLTMDDVEFISGETPEDMKASAEKLAGRVKAGQTNTTTNTTDVFAGTRGTATNEGPKNPNDVANAYMAQLIWGNGR
ncbi:hypothetical protein [Micromonospora sp. CB01531]|uniref:hypothetical protein n=1 Tax=Micromonospora sp. CB01531 TaxID=1718947 RepID=UPI00093B42C7|nr:hypothetical protein [Micromonospora sp. CB01531]OKI54512.1 hypothetical protein A6A27_31805 [Micromonospora sp. CB01531]